MLRSAFAAERGLMEHPTAKAAVESFGQRLRRFRKASGLTQRAFAAAVGLSQRMAAYWELEAIRPPPADQLAVMAKTLGVTADELIGLSEPQPNQRLLTRPLVHHLRLLEKLPGRERAFVLKSFFSTIRSLAHERGITSTGDDAQSPKSRLALSYVPRLRAKRKKLARLAARARHARG